MRIIGGHDYYDSAMAMGQDPHLVFQRNQHDPIAPAEAEAHGIVQRALPALEVTDLIKGKTLERRLFCEWGTPSSRVSMMITPVSVIACAKQYHGMHVQLESYRINTGRQVDRDIVWTHEQLSRMLRHRELGIEVAKRGFAFRHESRPRTLDGYFAPLELSGRALDFLIDRRIALMSRIGGRRPGQDNASWEVNRDDLETLAFYKVFDPYAMFQELAMFVGGVLPRSGEEMVEIDDRTRKHKHGFDEASFRKPPEKR